MDMKKIMMLALALSIAVILAACGDDKEDDKTKDEKTAGQAPMQELDISDEEKVKDDKVVLHINGEKVKGDQYNAIYPQIKMQATGMGQKKVDKKELKKQTLEALVGQELLKQEVDNKGIEVPKKEVDKQIEELKSQDEEQYKAFLKQFHLDEETLKDQLAFELQLHEYAEKEFKDIEPTDEEIKDQYKQFKAQGQGEDVPQSEEVKDQPNAQTTEENNGKASQKKTEQLNEKAGIKEKI